MIRVPIASDGWRFILPLWAVGLSLLWIGHSWGAVVGGLILALAVFCTAFFRDFNRSTQVDDNLIYSPADGKVVDVSVIEGGEYASWRIIRIFLSVFDGHVQRSPVAGKILDIQHRPGLFLDARDPRAHALNEQSTMSIFAPRGKVVVKQIAGLIARRIVCWAKRGDSLAQGERYGLIRFGSQVDVIIPGHAAVDVHAGDRVTGGKTVIARWIS